MRRKNIAAGNWKMNMDRASAKALVEGLVQGEFPGDVDMILGVPFVYLGDARSWTDGSGIRIAAQNCHPADHGAFTGEVSLPMLKDIGVETVIIGHSERREIFSESNVFLKEKVDAALAHGVQPVFCCGEPLEIRKSGNHAAYVETQLVESIFHLGPTDIAKLIIAYEPIWAIGTGETASPGQAEEMHAHIRALLTAKYGEETSESISILYGGSVKPGNASELFDGPNVDGGLVGGASLNADSFLQIANSFS